MRDVALNDDGCASSLCRELRGVLRPQKRRNKHRVGMQPEQESSDICFLCLTDHHDELILLCDGQGCTNAAHMFCLTPPLLSVGLIALSFLLVRETLTCVQVPSGNWLCPVCSQLDEVCVSPPIFPRTWLCACRPTPHAENISI